MTKQEVDELLRFSRAYCAERLPWFAPVIFSCKIHQTEKVPVAAIDQNLNIYFNPNAVEAIKNSCKDDKDTLAQLGFLWIHEVSHILRDHADRAKDIGVRPDVWNVAADLEINDSHWQGLRAPSAFPGQFPSQYKFPEGKLAEEYYEMLGGGAPDEDSNKIIPNPSNEEGEGGENKSPSSNQQKDNENQNDNTEDGNESQCEDNGDGEAQNDEGSGVHGEPRPWEVGDENEGQSLDEMEVERIRRSVAQEMKSSETMGSAPGSWGRWIDDKLEPKVDWRKKLRHRMSVAIATGMGARTDFSFARPSRRQSVYQPIIPPALTGDRSARVAVIVDTSGSMGAGLLAQCVAEVCNVLEAFQVPVTVIPCDAKAYEPIELATRSDYFKLEKLPGGGGTNMIVGIEAALKLKPAPDAVLVLTDGYTPYPPKLYKTPVLFGIFQFDRRNKAAHPPLPWRKDMVVDIWLDDLKR